MFNHSVWETPEGKFVDVTLNQKDLLICWNAFSDNKKEVIFTPAVVYHPDETFWEIRTYNLSFSDSIHNPIICTFANDERMMFPHNFVKRNKRQMRNLYLTKVKDDPITLGDWNDCNGGFSKPSAATGKSFDDLWNDRLTA